MFHKFLQDLPVPRGQNLAGRGDFSRPKGPASLGLYPKFRGVEALTKGLNRPNVFIV